MILRRPLLATAVLAAAACTHARPPAPPPSAEHARAFSGPKVPSYRFLASGGGAMHGAALEGGSVGVIEGAMRSVVALDGSVEKARTVAPAFLMGGEPVPARLGGGFLFWSPAVMYRARSFLGPLEPVAHLPTNAIDLAFGPGSLLIIDPGGGRKAYDLDKAQRVPLSPHGVLDIATGDDDRAVAVDASGRALASTDGGKTWKDVTGQLGGRAGRPCAASTQVGFEVSNKDGVWLATDGTMARGPLPDPHPSGAGSTDSGLRQVMAAIQAGIPLPGGQALVARGPQVQTVDLVTGAVLSTRAIETGPSCRVLSTEEEGLAVCYQYSVKNPSMTVVSHVLGPSPRTEMTFEGTLAPVYGAGTLIVSAACDGTHASSVACARRPGGAWTQYDAQPAVDATANPPPAGMAAVLTPMPVVWVPREDGGITALATKRPVKPGEQFHVARYDLPAGTPAFFDKVIAALEHYRWIVGRDNALRGFGPAAPGGPASSTIAVDARGHVETGARDFTDLAAADSTHALAGDGAHRLWQTVDGGAHWTEVATPPGKWGRSEATVIVGGQAIQCSLVGCVLPGTGGSWLRIGWPEDPPLARGAGVAAPGASETTSDGGGDRPAPPPEVVTAVPAASPAPVLARLRCTLRTEPQAVAPHPAGPSREGEESKALFGGRLFLERRGSETFVNLPYRDQYTGPGDTIGPQSIGFGLRAILHFPRTGQSTFGVTKLIQDKAAMEAWYVVPFDPSGAVVHGTTPFASWTKAVPALQAQVRGGVDLIRLNEGDDLTHGARPVLSSRPGHADGVLLGREGLVLWVDATGAVRPVAASQGRGTYSGYADAHGKLFVALEGSAGGTEVVEAETGVVRFRVPDALPFYPLLRSRASSYPAMPMHVFAAPDAVAVAPDGSIGILRIPSGVEPATEDDPALFLSGASAPVELASWSKVEIASSAACQRDHEGYRAVIQTGLPWIAMAGSLGFPFRTPGMSAMVRWSKDHVCLESVEVGYRQMEDSSSPTDGLKVMAVARFVGAGAEGGLVGTGREATVREPAKCALE